MSWIPPVLVPRAAQEPLRMAVRVSYTQSAEALPRSVPAGLQRTGGSLSGNGRPAPSMWARPTWDRPHRWTMLYRLLVNAGSGGGGRAGRGARGVGGRARGTGGGRARGRRGGP